MDIAEELLLLQVIQGVGMGHIVQRLLAFQRGEHNRVLCLHIAQISMSAVDELCRIKVRIILSIDRMQSSVTKFLDLEGLPGCFTAFSRVANAFAREPCLFQSAAVKVKHHQRNVAQYAPRPYSTERKVHAPHLFRVSTISPCIALASSAIV